MKSAVLSALLLLIASLYGTAQTCCSGGVPLASNVGGLPALDSGRIQLAAQFDVNILNTLKDENRILEDDSRSRKTYSALLHGGFSITNRIALEGLFSWVRQERRIRQPGGFDDFTSTQGIGDAVVLAQYKWWNRDRLKLILGAGTKLPLGSSDHKDENGIGLNADLQPGTGALDYVLSHKVEWIQMGGSLLNFVGNVVYRITGTNDKYLQSLQYRFGNEFQIMTGVGRQFFIRNQLLDFQVGLRFRSTKEDLINGVVLANTGGRWLYGNGGVVWNFTPYFSVSASVDIPVYSHVKGTQLSPSTRFIFGGYYLIQ